MGLASVLIDEGRYQEAEKLTRVALDVQRTIGIGDDTQTSAQMLSQLGAVLTFQRKDKDASDAYAQLDQAIVKWEPARRDALLQNGSRIAALLASGQIEAGVAAAEALVKRQSGRLGEKNFDTAAARGTLGVAYMKAGRDPDAVREFRRRQSRCLMAAARENADDDDASVNAARSGERLQAIVEVLYRRAVKRGAGGKDDAAIETFALD